MFFSLLSFNDGSVVIFAALEIQNIPFTSVERLEDFFLSSTFSMAQNRHSALIPILCKSVYDGQKVMGEESSDYDK